MRVSLIFALLLATPLTAQSPADVLIPRPTHAVALKGSWRIPAAMTVSWQSAGAQPVVALLGELLPTHPLRYVPARADLTLQLGAGPASDESYTLRVSDSGVVLTAPSVTGLRWGAQTLRQLIDNADQGSIAALEVSDSPRYAWRGAMLDVGRHWFPTDDIIRWIDTFARYKLNVFHWHLTEDQGWRLAINRYPRLTSVGAWRTEADGSRYGGFYTQADVRRVVSYAASRGITVVPEIEMPGHARAALAAYPMLGCTGKVLPVPSTWGVFDDVLCPTEPTFEFLQAVLTEVLALFPSEYIHIGGDEVPKRRWQSCGACRGIITKEKLGDEEGLQRWFTARIASWLKERGRRMIGWDEILNGGAPTGAVVQAWQGSERIKVALDAGADVIASPAEWVYINSSAKQLPLERILKFDPRAGTNDSPKVLGGEAPLWTEHVTSSVNAELMYFPRVIGLAEALWRGPAELGEFSVRLAGEVPRLEKAGIAVGPAAADIPRIALAYDGSANRLSASIVNPLPGVTLRSSGAGLAQATGDSVLTFGDSGTVVLQVVRGTSAIGESRRVTVVDHLARGKAVSLATPADARYPGTGGSTLTDGAQGDDFHDGLWNGWLGPDLDARIDLGASTPIRSVALSLLEEVRSWILYPTAVSVQLSEDGISWRDAGVAVVGVPTLAEGRSRRVVVVKLPNGTVARWVRVIAKNGGVLPTWHPGAGEASWLFADEVIVR